MGIELDISDVFAEVGVAFTIERLGVPVGGTEYLTYTANRQVTKPFVREYFLESVFTAFTDVQNGDVVTFIETGESFIVMNCTPDLFENNIIRYLAVLYKTNVLIDIYHPHNTTIGYNTTFDFQRTYASQKALIAEPLFGNIEAFDEHTGIYNLEKNQLFISLDYAIEEQDRVVIPSTNEVYRIESVVRRRFPNAIVADLGEDTRE